MSCLILLPGMQHEPALTVTPNLKDSESLQPLQMQPLMSQERSAFWTSFLECTLGHSLCSEPVVYSLELSTCTSLFQWPKTSYEDKFIS